MTKIWLTLFITVLYIICIAQQPKNDWERELLLGKVKKVRYSDSLIIPGIKSSNTRIYFVDSFSKQGLKIQSYQVKNNIIVASGRFNYRFDSNGKITEQNYIDTVAGVGIRKEFTYNSIGKIVEQKEYYDGRVRDIKYIYKSDTVVVKEDSSSAGKYTTINIYDNRGYLIEIRNLNNSQAGIIQYMYDEFGNKTSEMWPNLNFKTTFKYDRHGNEVLKMRFDMNGTVSKTYSIKYWYDRHGNWTRRIDDISDDMGNEAPTYLLTIRQIEYYD